MTHHHAALEALEQETQRTGEFLAALADDDWIRPTRCVPLDVHALAAHAWRGSMRIHEMIEAGPVDVEPEKDGVTYFRYDAAAEGPMIVQRAQEVAAERGVSGFAAAWLTDWFSACERARKAMEHHDPVLKSVFGLMHLSQYLRTRVLEVTIHTMDLREAVGLSPDPTAEGLNVTCEVLRGLLGTDLRPLGVDDVRFAITATGRGSLDDAERALLGPLADLFPLLA